MIANYMESLIYEDVRRQRVRKNFQGKPSKVTYNCG